MPESATPHTTAPDGPERRSTTPVTPGLVWSDALSLSMPVMDATHQEFVHLLSVVQAAPDDALLPAWDALIEHTDDHFRREDDWMLATGFAPANCHSTQHKVVLQVLREGARKGRDEGDLAVIRQMAHELTLWFPHHAQTMDAGLALHLKSVGYDPATGKLSSPDALPADALTGCGSGSCSDSPSAREAAPAAA